MTDIDRQTLRDDIGNVRDEQNSYFLTPCGVLAYIQHFEAMEQLYTEQPTLEEIDNELTQVSDDGNLRA